MINATIEAGKFVFKLFALLAEHERKRLIRRTKVGHEVARAIVRMGGRPKGLLPYYQETASILINAYKQVEVTPQSSFREITKAFKIPAEATVHKILNRGCISQNKNKSDDSKCGTPIIADNRCATFLFLASANLLICSISCLSS